MRDREKATDWMFAALKDNPDHALAGATPYLRLMSVCGGGAALARGALVAQGLDASPANTARVMTARFFAENICPTAGGLAETVMGGAETVLDTDAALAS